MSNVRKPSLEELVLMAQAVSNNKEIPDHARVKLGGVLEVAVFNEVSHLCSRNATLVNLSHADYWRITESLILNDDTH